MLYLNMTPITYTFYKYIGENCCDVLLDRYFIYSVFETLITFLFMLKTTNVKHHILYIHAFFISCLMIPTYKYRTTLFVKWEKFTSYCIHDEHVNV